MIPAVHGDLHKTHAGLAETTGKQGGAAVFVGRLFPNAVRLLCGLGFVSEIDEVRRGRLHAKSRLQAVDHALHARVRLILPPAKRLQSPDFEPGMTVKRALRLSSVFPQ